MGYTLLREILRIMRSVWNCGVGIRKRGGEEKRDWAGLEMKISVVFL